jgi:hypothetical protein
MTARDDEYGHPRPFLDVIDMDLFTLALKNTLEE